MSGFRSFLPDGLPPHWPTTGQTATPLEQQTLREMNQRLRPLYTQPAAAWLNETPLVPRLDERADLSHMDRDIAANLWALEAVCARPRSHLSYRIERVPAVRVRRAPPRALAHLSSHTEDWEGTTLRGVHPRRLLAEQREELLDQYENRVAARLIERLERWLRRRCHELAQIIEVLDEFERAQDEASQGNHWRQRRLYQLFASSMEASERDLRKKALRTQLALQSLWHRVAGLRDTQLYREIPPRAQLGATLRMTNVLSSDPLYLCVARLYLAWQAEEKEPTLEELQRQEEDAAAGFSDFALLVMLHALRQLGYCPDDAPLIGDTLHLRAPHGETVLCWQSRGRFLKVEDAELRVVLYPLALFGTDPEDERELDAVLAEKSGACLVLHLGTGAASPLSRELRARLYGQPRAAVAPISPWELGSVERVARQLRWFLLSRQLLSYPPRVSRPPSALALQARSWFRDDGAGLALLRPPIGDAERRRVDDEFAKAKSRQEETAAAQWSAQEVRSQSKDDRRARTTANQRATQATHRHAGVQQEKEDLERFLRSLESAEARLLQLLRCPICRRTEDLRIEPRGQDSFYCRCPGCGGGFGIGCCACGERFPFLWPGTAWPPRGEISDAVDWVDRLVGCDVLALPCIVNHGAEPRYRCPACGTCPEC